MWSDLSLINVVAYLKLRTRFELTSPAVFPVSVPSTTAEIQRIMADDIPLTHERLWDLASNLDFSDTRTSQFRRLEDDFNTRRKDYAEFLHTLAHCRIEFNQRKGDELLRWILQLPGKHSAYDLLHSKTKLGNRTTPIHEAISVQNNGFLESILSAALEPEYRKLLLDIEVVAALRTRNDDEGNSTCLYLSVKKKLPCVEKMVVLCAQVERQADAQLREIIKNRKIADQWTGQRPDKKLESIFLMRNTSNNTFLHLLMETKNKPWPLIQTKRQLMSRGETANNALKRHSRNNEEFNPLNIIETLDNSLKTSKATSMGDLWTAINNEGLSPYKRLLQISETGVSVKLLREKIFGSLAEIPKLKRALYGTRGEEKELCLDMSDFNQSSHDFKKFVDELIKSTDELKSSTGKLTKSTDKQLQFEECLLSVFLPDLNIFKKDIPHDGVRELFKWLHGEGNVKRIKSLSIPDSTTRPMSDELVSEAIVDVFEIEKMDWRKLDINLDILVRSPHHEEFTDITLYSTGNYSVLYHWISEHGLKKLTGLRKVTIEIMEWDKSYQPEEARKRHEMLVGDYKKEVDAYLEKMKIEKKNQVPSIEFEYDVNPEAKWDFPQLQYHEPQYDEKLELLTKLEVCHDFLRRMTQKAKDDTRYGTTYGNYDESFRQLKHEPGLDKPALIKVAIIDNGADKFRQKIREVIEKGVSYVKADSESAHRILPWWMVSDPHGTQMAYLVAKANPWCRLYIARVGKSRKDILPEDAVEAVKWAVEQGVDVISISWITKGDFPELKLAIEEAAKHALVFCSTADEGTWANPVFPACYEGTIRVSATDRYGNLMPASDHNAINIPVPGQNVPAFGPSYMGAVFAGTVSGSSVATALAAGMASLALLLLQVFNQTDRERLKEENFYNNEQIVKVLKRINATEKQPALFPTLTSELDQLPQRWKIENFKD